MRYLRSRVRGWQARTNRSAWLVSITFVAVAAAVIFLFDIPTADSHHPGGLYALTASAQALAAVLGLVLATSAVVAQLRALFSRRTLGIGFFREVFGWGTMAMVLIYGIVIWLQLAVVAQRNVEPWVTQTLLLASAVCLSALAPYLSNLRGRLSPVSSLEGVERELDQALGSSPGKIERLVGDVEDFGLTAVEQHDYATLRRSLQILEKALVYAPDPVESEGSFYVVEALRKIALVGFDDPLTVPQVLKSIQSAGRSLCRDGLSARNATIAGQVCTAVARIADRAVQAGDPEDAAGCADILGEIGEDLSREGWSERAASAVGGLHALKVDCVNERMQKVSARAASHLARIRPGAELAHPWPRRTHYADPTPTNLLLNASFEFGHDFGHGLEPGWHKGPFARSMWMKAETYASPGRNSQYHVRMVADGRNQSLAQDVQCSPTLGESFVAVCRAASAEERTVWGRFALWGLGAPEERGEVIYELPPARPSPESFRIDPGATWVALRAPLDVRASSHEALRAEIYIDSSSGRETMAGGSILLDDVAIVPANLRNASFELEELSPWELLSPSNEGKWEICRHEKSPLHVGGEWYLRLEPTQLPVSIQQTTSLPVAGGRTYELSAAVQSGSGAPVKVLLEVHSAERRIAEATFTAEASWRHVYLPFSLDGSAEEANCSVVILVEEGLLHVDDVAIVPTLLHAADMNDLDPWNYSPSAHMDYGTPSPDYGGPSRAVTAGDQPALIWQEIPATPRVGTSYHLATRMRLGSESQREGSVTVQVKAVDKGGAKLGLAESRVVLTDIWQTVGVPFDCRRGDILGLVALAEIEMETSVEFAGFAFNPLALPSTEGPEIQSSS